MKQYLRVAKADSSTLCEIVEVHAAVQHGSCDVTIVNPATKRRVRLSSWTSDIIEGYPLLVCSQCDEGNFFQRAPHEAVYVCSVCALTVSNMVDFKLSDDTVLLGSEYGLMVAR